MYNINVYMKFYSLFYICQVSKLCMIFTNDFTSTLSVYLFSDTNVKLLNFQLI